MCVRALVHVYASVFLTSARYLDRWRIGCHSRRKITIGVCNLSANWIRFGMFKKKKAFFFFVFIALGLLCYEYCYCLIKYTHCNKVIIIRLRLADGCTIIWNKQEFQQQHSVSFQITVVSFFCLFSPHSFCTDTYFYNFLIKPFVRFSFYIEVIKFKTDVPVNCCVVFYK